MPVNLTVPELIHPVPGVRIGTASANIKHSGRDDLAVFAFEPGTEIAGVYT